MNKEQVQVLEKFGYIFKEVPNLYQEPKATFYRIVNGEVMECPNLPADPLSLRHYLGKGFTLTRPNLSPQTKEGEIVCTVCGKACKSAFGLQSHSRKHKK